MPQKQHDTVINNSIFLHPDGYIEVKMKSLKQEDSYVMSQQLIDLTFENKNPGHLPRILVDFTDVPVFDPKAVEISILIAPAFENQRMAMFGANEKVTAAINLIRDQSDGNDRHRLFSSREEAARWLLS